MGRCEEIDRSFKILGLPRSVTKTELQNRYQELKKVNRPNRNLPGRAGNYITIINAYKEVCAYLEQVEEFVESIPR